jgi:membrane protease YdiL (CAAX protease family)
VTPGGTEWAFTIILLALLTLVSIGTVRSAALLQWYIPPGNMLLGWPDNIVRILAVVGCVILGVTLGPGPQALGWTPDAMWRDLAVGVVSGLIFATILSFGAWLVVRLWGPEVVSTRMVQSILPVDEREWAGVLAALLPAALLEELLFRSLPLGGLAWLISPWLLLWPLSLLFGLLHWPQGGWGVVGATLAGVCLSFLFLITGSLWAALAAHYVMNVQQLVAAKRAGLAPLRAPARSTPGESPTA